MVLLLLTNPNSTFPRRSIDFAIENIYRVQEITLKQGENKIKFSKIPEGWQINNEHLADIHQMQNFLRILENIKMKSPVSIAERPKILELMLNEGIEVSVRKRWATKRIIVWHRQNSPTYMLKGNSKLPFEVEVPGLIGEVGEAFRVDEGFWRENVIFAYNFNYIRRIAVEYPTGFASGFEIILTDDNRFEIYSLPEKRPLKNVSDTALFRYITYFSYVPFNKLLTQTKPEILDSLNQALPFANLSVTRMQGEETQLKLHLIKTEGQIGEHDLNLLYGTINKGKDLVLLTFFNVDLLLKDTEFFKLN